MTGLEGMFLKARAGESVKATDVFMHCRKWWPLFIDACVIGWHVGWFVFLLSLVAFGLFMLLNQLFLVPVVNPAIFFGIAELLILLAACYRESRHLHALNLAAEFGLKGADSRHISRLAIKKRLRDTLFVVLLAIVFVCYWSFHKILTPLSLLLLLEVMGATSMVFLYDLVENKEIFDLINQYREAYQKGSTAKAENPCPTCDNSNVRKAYIEDGGQGDWCPDCEMSLQRMRGLA
jgi:hypothetical protein